MSGWRTAGEPLRPSESVLHPQHSLVAQSLDSPLGAETVNGDGFGWRAPSCPAGARRQVLIRTDSGGGTHDFPAWVTSSGSRLHYSVGMTITEDMHRVILALPEWVWEPAHDADRHVRRGAWVAELTGLRDLSS